jgi:hypothetical protein
MFTNIFVIFYPKDIENLLMNKVLEKDLFKKDINSKRHLSMPLCEVGLNRF